MRVKGEVIPMRPNKAPHVQRGKLGHTLWDMAKTQSEDNLSLDGDHIIL